MRKRVTSRRTWEDDIEGLVGILIVFALVIIIPILLADIEVWGVKGILTLVWYIGFVVFVAGWNNLEGSD